MTQIYDILFMVYIRLCICLTNISENEADLQISQKQEMAKQVQELCKENELVKSLNEYLKLENGAHLSWST